MNCNVVSIQGDTYQSSINVALQPLAILRFVSIRLNRIRVLGVEKPNFFKKPGLIILNLGFKTDI